MITSFYDYGFPVNSSFAALVETKNFAVIGALVMWSNDRGTSLRGRDAAGRLCGAAPDGAACHEWDGSADRSLSGFL